jgi:hypothetical protein
MNRPPQEQRFWASHCTSCRRYYTHSGASKPELCVEKSCAAAGVKLSAVVYTGSCSLSMPQLFLELEYQANKLERFDAQLTAQAKAYKDLQNDYLYQHETIQRLLNKVDELEKKLVQSADKK